MSITDIKATDRSPEVKFDFESNVFHIAGESYPEDVNSFYGPLMEMLEEHLSNIKAASVNFSFELIYFNSSTAKILMSLFDMLDEAASQGNQVQIDWCFEEDDDNMEELGEEYGEDLEHAKFSLKSQPV